MKKQWPSAPGPKGKGWPVGKNGFREVRTHVHQDMANNHEKTIGIGTAAPSYTVQRNFVLPTVVNGKEVSPDEAERLFQEGKNRPVGMYSTQIEADRAAAERSKNSK